MPNNQQPQIPGSIVFSFSFEDGKNGRRQYHMLYNEQMDEYSGTSQLVAAMFQLLKEFPVLIEPMLYVAQKAAEELEQPFEEILKKK